MDSGVLEESSSSPSGKLYIRTIDEGVAGGQIEIVLTDGSSFYVSPNFLHERQLREGDSVSEELLLHLSEETIAAAARTKALEYLARREHSRLELKAKLLRKDYPETTVERVLEECEERDYLNDERFARVWTEARIRRKTEGPGRIAGKLSQKGVPREIIERVTRELFTEEVLERLISQAAERGRRVAGDDPMKLKRYLVSRGFTISQINKYFC